MAATVARFGGVDVLVTNSGGPALGRFPDFTDDDWRQAFEVVTLNIVRFVREVVPHMRQSQWGRIIGIQGPTRSSSQLMASILSERPAAWHRRTDEGDHA